MLQRKTILIPRGNVAGGAIDRLPGGAVAWPQELFRALHRTLSSECGPAAESILRNAGQMFGKQLGQRVRWDLANYHETTLGEIPAARVAASLQSGFAKHGWGLVVFHFDRHATGLIEIEVVHGLSTIWADRNVPVGDHLLAGTFAGLFSELAGLKLDCLQTDYEVPGSAPARFVIGLPERLVQAANMARQGQPHLRVVEYLETTQA